MWIVGSWHYSWHMLKKDNLSLIIRTLPVLYIVEQTNGTELDGTESKISNLQGSN